MATLAVLQPDPTASARIEAALGGDHHLVSASGWQQLWDLAARHSVDGCVLDLHRASRRASFRELHRLRRHHPALAIVVYADFEGREQELFRLGRLRVDGVIMADDRDQRHDIRDAVATALASSVASRVTAALAGRLPDPGLECLTWSVEHAEEGPSVTELARARSVDRRRLARELREAGLPPARTLLLWGRLFRAGQLLENRTRTVESIAYRTGYASAAGLRRALKRHVGHPPSRVRRRGGLAIVMEGFLREVTPPAGRRRWGLRPARAWTGPTRPPP